MAYIYERNHRMAFLLNEDVPWVLLKVNYFFLSDDHDKKFNFILRLVNGNRPANLKHSDLGFETRKEAKTTWKQFLSGSYANQLFLLLHLYIDIF